MEKPEKCFLRRIGRNIANDDPDMSDKKIKTALLHMIDSLPNGDLKVALLKNKRECIAYLVRRVRREGKEKKDDQVTSTRIQNGDHKEPVSVPSVSDNNTAGGHSQQSQLAASAVLQQIIQLLRSGKDVDELSTLTEELWVKAVSQRPEIGHMDKYCALLRLMDGSSNQLILRNIMNLYLNFLCGEMEKISGRNSKEGAQQRLSTLNQFLKMCHLRHTAYEKEEVANPSYSDLVAALVSIYLDLFVIAHRGEAVQRSVQRKTCQLLKEVTANMGEKALDSVLQLSSGVDHNCVDLFSPLVRGLLREKPEKSFSHYLRYILTVQMWQDVLTRMDEAVSEARMIRAPKGFTDWVLKWQPSLDEHFPSDRKFKGLRVTAFILDDADKEVLELLKNAIVNFEMGSGGESQTEEDEQHGEGQKEVDEEAKQKRKKQKKKKKQKKTTTADDDGQAKDTEEEGVSFTIDKGNKEPVEENTAGLTENGEPEAEVEVFDWTKFGEDDADNNEVPSLFMIDRGEKRSTKSDLGEEPKKKKKKKPSEKTVLKNAEPQEESSDITQSTSFFLDRGEGRKTKKRSAENVEDSKDAEPKKAKKKKQKLHEDNNEMMDDTVLIDVGSTEAQSEAVLSVSSDNASEKPGKKEKKGSQQVIEDTLTLTPESDNAQKIVFFTDRGGQSSVQSISEESVDVESKRVKKKKGRLSGSDDRTEKDEETLVISSPQETKESVVTGEPKPEDTLKSESYGLGSPVIPLQETFTKRKLQTRSRESLSDRESSLDNEKKKHKRKTSLTIVDVSVDSQAHRQDSDLPASPLAKDRGSRRRTVSEKSVSDQEHTDKKQNRISLSPTKNKLPTHKAARDAESTGEDVSSGAAYIGSPAGNIAVLASVMAGKSADKAKGSKTKALPIEIVPNSDPEESFERSSYIRGSVGTSNSEVLVPDLSVHLKTRSPKTGADSSVSSSVNDAANGVREHKESALPDAQKTGLDSPVSLSPDTETSGSPGKELRSRRKRSSLSATLSADSEDVKESDQQNEEPKMQQTEESMSGEDKTESDKVRAKQATPQTGTETQKKTPKSTTPVSRRTRSRNVPAAPSSALPVKSLEMSKTSKPGLKSSVEDASSAKEMSPSKRKKEARTTSPTKVTSQAEASKDQSSSAPDVVVPKKSKQSKEPISSEDTESNLSRTPKTPVVKRKQASNLLSALQKKATRQRLSVSEHTTSKKKPLSKKSGSNTGFTKLKAAPESPAAKSDRRRSSSQQQPEQGEDRPDEKTISSPGKTSPQKGTSSLSGHDIETRSKSLQKGYNLRRSRQLQQQQW